MMASQRKRQDDKNLKLLRELAALPHNKKCFDCGQRGPTYVNMTIGSFVCTACSGILRGLNPPHRVKSISMTSFSEQEIQDLQKSGNEFCRKTWLGLWNSNSPPEPDSRDEHKIKDFMIQKYERKRWYIPPAPEDTNKPTPTSAPEPKPLKHLLGETSSSTVNSLQSQSVTSGRERPRTGSQSSASTISAPAAQPAPQPVAPPSQTKAPAVDLLADLGGDPFAQSAPAQGFGAFGGAPQPAANTFNAFGAPAVPAQTNTFDPFGGSSTQPAQPTQGGFAAFGTPQQQASPFGAAPAASSSSFNAFGTTNSSAPMQPTGVSGSQPGDFGPLVSATTTTPSVSANVPSGTVSAPGADRYAALSQLDSLFGSSDSSTSSSAFGSSSNTSLGMSSGPNPFASTAPISGGSAFGQSQPQPPASISGGFGQSPPQQQAGLGGAFGQSTPQQQSGMVGAFGQSTSQQQSGMGGSFGQSNLQQQSGMGGSFGQSTAQQQSGMGGGFGQTQQSSNPFQGFGGGGSGAAFGQMNGPGSSMTPSTSLGVSGSTSGFGNFASASPGQPGGMSGGGMFGSQPQSQPQQQSMGWSAMSAAPTSMGMVPASSPQNLSFGGAGMTAMAAAQFGKVGAVPQQQGFGGQPQGRFGGGQMGGGNFGGQFGGGNFGGQMGQGFGTAQGIGSQQGGFATQQGGGGARFWCTTRCSAAKWICQPTDGWLWGSRHRWWNDDWTDTAAAATVWRVAAGTAKSFYGCWTTANAETINKSVYVTRVKHLSF